ncbi:UNVERIFIED_CONTAM: hypothetical protein GTU68_009503 [Idotea baltica]|nr:hypothetical protein [Idotea baltica]
MLSAHVNASLPVTAGSERATTPAVDNPVGKSPPQFCIGLALIKKEGLPRALHPHHRSGPEAPAGAPRSRPRKRHRKTRQVPSADPRRHRLCHQGSGRNQRALRTHQRALRAAVHADHRKPAVRRLGRDLP